jgi:hypothetical protein
VEDIDSEMLDTIVQNIFRKAQLEKEYCIFYGQLCENIIKLETQLKGLEIKMKNTSKSVFRMKLLEVCKLCFEKFFDGDEKKKQTENLEAQVLFKIKLYGNIEFVGELYRRAILSDKIINIVLSQLLCIEDYEKQTQDDLLTEAAINLMNKVGQEYERKAEKAKSTDKQE